MRLEENKPLAPFTTFGIGGPARWFVEARGEDEVVEAARWARERGAALFVLGGGSNLLVADAGFDGLVLRVGIRGLRVAEEGRARVFEAAAGEDWDGLVQQTVEQNCAGIECLAGIPGTVGGTPVQNVGAYGQEVASTIQRVRAFDLEALQFVEFSAEECGFAYRRSRFNGGDRGRFIVTRVEYRLRPGGAPTLGYEELKRAVEGGASEGRMPSLAEVASEVRRLRRRKGMLLIEGDPDCRSAGSFFKNPLVGEETLQRVAAVSGKQPPRFPAGPEVESAGRFKLAVKHPVKLPAAWLIEQAGYPRGFTIGRAGISSRHALALVNRGDATAAEVMALAAQIGDAVEARFGIRLEMEPVLVGF